MAIKVSGVTVIDDSRNATNLETVTANNLSISGTTGLKIPVGTEAQRPGAPETGQLRFNTDASSVEIFDGSAFTSVGGGVSTGLVYFLAARR